MRTVEDALSILNHNDEYRILLPDPRYAAYALGQLYYMIERRKGKAGWEDEHDISSVKWYEEGVAFFEAIYLGGDVMEELQKLGRGLESVWHYVGSSFHFWDQFGYWEGKVRRIRQDAVVSAVDGVEYNHRFYMENHALPENRHLYEQAYPRALERARAIDNKASELRGSSQ